MSGDPRIIDDTIAVDELGQFERGNLIKQSNYKLINYHWSRCYIHSNF